jgi:acetyltransferase-like isoleucine patch superfamily enzyme
MIFRVIRHLSYLYENCLEKIRSCYYTHFIRLYQGKVGKNLVIRRGAKILITKGGKISIGADFLLGEGADLFVGQDGKLEIGDGVFIGKNSTVVANGEVKIGAGSQIAHLVTLIDSDHQYSDPKRPLAEQGGTIGHISVGKSVWIGANAVVLKNTDLGDHAVVGAASVITKSVPAHAVVAGNPAQKIK